MTMNRYGHSVRRHWELWLPVLYARIDDPDSWFAALGEYAAQGIDELADEVAGDDPPGEGYLGKVARLTAAREQAEQAVLRDLCPVPVPDEDDEDDEDELAAVTPPLIIWQDWPAWTPN